MGRWDRLTQTRKRLVLEAECASFRYRREWAGYRGGYLHLEELQNLSNSTLHNTAGRTQAVNISAVQRMVGGKKEDSEQKKQREWKLENRSSAARDVQLIQSLVYVIVFGSGQLEKLFPAGRQIRTKAEARPAGFRRDIVSDGVKATRAIAKGVFPPEWVGIRTYVETSSSSSSSSCTCGYRSNPEGVATTAAPLCGGLLIGVAKSEYSFAYRILETPVTGSENAGRDTCVIVSAMWVSTLDGARNGNGWGRLIIVDNGATTRRNCELQEKRQNGDYVSRSTFKNMKRFTTEESNGTFYSLNPLTRRGPSGGTLDYKGATFSSQATTRQIVDVDNRRIRSGAKEEEDEVSFSRGSCHHSGTSSAHQSPSFAKETIRRSFVTSIES
ncbi:hypothetical protein ALC60_02401 [Trachymyrmex zeteki]|uniref:Uncharacterized protein n=1 Tax=Mycetomoellerius zeteki TaxID=64791 RepID=A0A151XEG7_9HYME|nr:hypothetical protein ALC60_02401 [Trachymyrmex zeteki]